MRFPPPLHFPGAHDEIVTVLPAATSPDIVFLTVTDQGDAMFLDTWLCQTADPSGDDVGADA